MKNYEITQALLTATDSKAKDFILSAIAKHYGITKQEVLEEILHPEAEHICDYLVGGERDATYVLLQKHGLV